MQDPPQSLSPAAEQRASLLTYSACFSYTIAYGVVLLLVPLYAIDLGYDFTELGIIIASQAIFGLGLRLFAGAICDRFGERPVLWFSFATMIVGCAIFPLSGAFWMLVLGQVFVGFSRATFWTSIQSYTSRINEAKSGALLGRMSSSGNVGQLAGTAAAGFLAGALGFGFAWWATVAIGIAGFLGSLLLPELPRKETRAKFTRAMAAMPTMAKDLGMGMGGLAAFVASAALAFTSVLLIPYLKEAVEAESTVGVLRTIAAGATVLLGVWFGRLLARLGQRRLYFYSYGLMGATMLVIPIAGGGLWALVPLMVAFGGLYGIMVILYPTTASTYSAPEQRGMAMAYVGLYWGTAQLVVPLAFGVIAAMAGLAASFYIGGAILLALAAAIPIAFPWLTSRAAVQPAP